MNNPAIKSATVTRRLPLATAAERRAIAHQAALAAIDAADRTHQAALAAIDAANRTNALIDAIRVEHVGQTMNQVVNDIRMKPQVPAILPDAPVVHTVAAHQPLTARLVAMTLGGLMLFMAGVATGRML